MHWIFLCNQGVLILPATMFLQGRAGLKQDSASSTLPTMNSSPMEALPGSRAGTGGMRSCCSPICHTRQELHGAAKNQSYGWRIHFKPHSLILESKHDIVSTEGNLIALHLYRWLIKQICLSCSKWLLKSGWYTNTWSSLLPENVGQLRYFIACPS